ncbi:IQ motif and ubiquitin-like domain-containing protein [Diretmus argenteus]
MTELHVRPHGATQLEMSSSDPTNHPPQHDRMPEVVTVRIHADQDVFQDVAVEIERPPQQKVFLGGYRHRVTGAEYHHAATQTPPRRRPDRGVAVFSRDTQAGVMRTQNQQCPVSTSTQMTRIGCYVSCLEDKLVSPGDYVTAEQYHARRLSAVIRLQAWARRWLAQRLVEGLRRQRDRKLAGLVMEERRRRVEKEEQLRDEHRQHMNPRSREDFTKMYHALEKWRLEEKQRIDSSLCGAERKAALCSLHDQETHMIADIGRHGIIAQHSNDEKAVMTFLDKCAAPKRWRSADGRMTEMSTQQSLRAGRLRDLYTSLSLEDNQDQRTEKLQTLRQTVQEHDSLLTRQIVELIDREVDLMKMGVEKTKLEGLRMRISMLLFKYIKKNAYNPAATKLLKVPQNPSQRRKKVHYCCGCRRYLQAADFTCLSLSVRQCRVCAEQDNVAHRRDELSLYKNILTRLRDDEAQIGYLLQEEDVGCLVALWGGRSALSACKDLQDLVLVRWDPLREWSPWNCILLTKDEAADHMMLENVHELYDAAFIRSVELNHTMAKKSDRWFHEIAPMAEYLRNTESQPTALGNQLVSKPVTTATDKHPANI